MKHVTVKMITAFMLTSLQIKKKTERVKYWKLHKPRQFIEDQFWEAGGSPVLPKNLNLQNSVNGLVVCKYSRVHKSSDSFLSKILEKPSIVQKKMIPHINGLGFSLIWSKKKFKKADLENSKLPPQKNLIFQLRQFLSFFHEIIMVWVLG